MTLAARGYEYPKGGVRIAAFPENFSTLFPQPPGVVEDVWPPTQLGYLGEYLQQLGCKTVLIENHYIDRDYIQDLALFYARSLRSYPNHCQRIHFFGQQFDQAGWENLIEAARSDRHGESEAFLRAKYLGFAVIRPLSGSPVGRTVLPVLASETPAGFRRAFHAVRDYEVHIAGFTLAVRGLAFQQQDQGVSACATAALWSALHSVGPIEQLPIPTPAEITQAASRYVLAEGRALPSEGLTINQICEATRASGLSPLVIRSTNLEHDRAQIAGYVSSGFPVLLAILPLNGSGGHAICVLGLKRGTIAPQTNPDLHYRDGASAIVGVYAHDDRLGPYASVGLLPFTTPQGVRTGVAIAWPGQAVEAEQSILRAVVVPAPMKLRLTVARMRALGHVVAESVGRKLGDSHRNVTLDCRYVVGTGYRRAGYGIGLSSAGVNNLVCDLVLSRYVGLIEISADDKPFLDVLLDATETSANPAVLACVRRTPLPGASETFLKELSTVLGAPWIT
jgi:hypothetical protein